MGRKKMGGRGGRGADKEFGLLPVPRMGNPFSSSRGQTTEIMWIPITPSVIPVSAGAIANSLNITASSIPNFSDYAKVWEEYVLRAIQWEIIAIGTQIGTVKLYIDESDNTAPTATTAKSHYGWVIRANGASGDRKKVRWVAKDTGDETWRGVSVTNTFITALKMYSDASSWGLTGTTEAVLLVNAMACIQFRTAGGP